MPDVHFSFGTSDDTLVSLCDCEMYLAVEYSQEINYLLKHSPLILDGKAIDHLEVEPSVPSQLEDPRKADYYNKVLPWIAKDDAYVRWHDDCDLSTQLPLLLCELWAKKIIDISPSRYYSYSETFSTGKGYGPLYMHEAHNYFDTDGGYCHYFRIVRPAGTWGGMQEYATIMETDREPWLQKWKEMFPDGKGSVADFYKFREEFTTAFVNQLLEHFSTSPDWDPKPLSNPLKEPTLEENPRMV